MRLCCTSQVFDWVFGSNPIFSALNQPERFRVTRMEERKVETLESGLAFEAFSVSDKVPSYVKTPSAGRDGAVVAFKIIGTRAGSSILIAPAVKQIDERFIAAAAECDCLMFDGSFWSDDEMELRGAGTRTASAMGHLPISGTAGSLAQLGDLRIRKIYTHINNTNPILDENSEERRSVEKTGWEVAEDGMDFTL